MKGYIKVEAAEQDGRQGVKVRCELEHVSFMDRLNIVHSVAKSLHMSSSEMRMLTTLMSSGIMDAMLDTVPAKDEPEAETKEQECTCKCEGKCKESKGPKVQVVELDGLEGLGELLKELFK